MKASFREATTSFNKSKKLILIFGVLFSLPMVTWSAECKDELQGQWKPARPGFSANSIGFEDSPPGYNAYASVPIEHGVLGCAMKFTKCVKLPDGRITAELAGEFYSIRSEMKLELINNRRLFVKSMSCSSRLGGFAGVNFYMQPQK